MTSVPKALRPATEAAVLFPTLGCLIAITLLFKQNPIRETFLTMILYGVCLGYASYGIYSSFNIEKVKSSELISLGILAGIFCTGIWWGMLFPPFLYSIFPFLSAFSFYFPASIVYGVMRETVKFRGAPFIYFVIYGIVSQIFFPNLYWIPYYIGWGGVAEILSVIGEKYGEGFGFGFAGSGLCKGFIILNWGQWSPLFWIVPSIFVDGGLSIFGFLIGKRIGERVKSLPM